MTVSTSSVPGAFRPGAAWPGYSKETTTPGNEYLFLGHYSVYYLDYVDLSTFEVLHAIPGNSYSMEVASGRVMVLAVPPADGRWQGGGGFLGDEVLIRRNVYAESLAAGRRHNAARHAAMARGIL
jgi:hypothetical protein